MYNIDNIRHRIESDTTLDYENNSSKQVPSSRCACDICAGTDRP